MHECKTERVGDRHFVNRVKALNTSGSRALLCSLVFLEQEIEYQYKCRGLGNYTEDEVLAMELIRSIKLDINLK